MDNKQLVDERARALAEAVRQSCVQTALAAYENARMDGLCHEGAWEMAVGALQQMDLAIIVQNSQPQGRQ